MVEKGRVVRQGDSDALRAQPDIVRQAAVNDWCSTRIGAGFDAFQSLVDARGHDGPFACGERPTLADVYLVPQIESARRFKVDMTRWARLLAIEAACGRLEAFQRAAPAVQPDAG